MGGISHVNMSSNITSQFGSETALINFFLSYAEKKKKHHNFSNKMISPFFIEMIYNFKVIIYNLKRAIISDHFILS